MSMKSGALGTLIAVALFTTSASAQITFDLIGAGAALDISGDGSVVVGNTNVDFETFRWTELDGIVTLGRSTAPLGTGAGTPDVSLDGTKVSATILGDDGTYVTQGIWTLGSGWQETMPPGPPDAGMLDAAWGSAWGLSGDGSTLVGLYWRPGQPGGSAHASRWTSASGVVDLGATVGNSRANDANLDGSVIVGWDEAPFGTWLPTVWIHGVLTRLTETSGFSQAAGVNEGGTIIVGQSWDEQADKPSGAVWRWNGTIYEEELLGSLFGTHPIFGTTQFVDLTEDGRVLVGFNNFDPGNSTGILWTQELGLVDVEQWLLANGITLPPDIKIRSLTGISLDGSVICGVAQELVFPFGLQSFLIHTEFATSAPVVSLGFEMGRVYPNPFNPRATIPVLMGSDGVVQLEILDVRGRRIRLLHDGVLGAGEREFQWDGTDLTGRAVASGTYFARLIGGDGPVVSRPLTLLK